MSAVIVSTGSLYYWFEPYEQTLDERIHAALDAGADGVEISNGPSILTWSPARDTVHRLRNKIVTVHAEILWGITLDEWTKAVARLPFHVANTVFHPDELRPDELPALSGLPFPASIENMDPTRDDWRTIREMQRVIYPGVGFTLDTAHAEDNGLPVEHFSPLFVPQETHLSISNDHYYDADGIQTSHALSHFRPNDFPHVPSACPIVTLEGVVPAGDVDALETEIDFVKSRLR